MSVNKDNAKYFLPLVQALADGKTIQITYNGCGEWNDAKYLSFVEPLKNYRIKPEPREYWLCKKHEYNGYTVVNEQPTHNWDEVIHVVEKL